MQFLVLLLTVAAKFILLRIDVILVVTYDKSKFATYDKSNYSGPAPQDIGVARGGAQGARAPSN